MSDGHTTAQLGEWLVRLRAGDDRARDAILQVAGKWLKLHAHRMLRRYSHLRGHEQTDDVMQNASIRLFRALREIHPETVADFYGLAATQVRRELIDLGRHHFGSKGDRAHAVSPADAAGSIPVGVEAAPAPGASGSLEAWVAFHEAVEQLPDAEREVVNLLFYDERSQADAAEVLGVTDRTVRHRWQSARLHLHEALRGCWPEGS